MASVGKQPDWREKPNQDQSRTVMGNSKNFWIWSPEEGFDLTHPPTPDSDPVPGRLTLPCALTPIVLDPAKTALLIIDFSNYDMHPALGNANPVLLDAERTVLKYAVPAARHSGMQIIWVTTGYSEEDLRDMDPAVLRTFNWQPVTEDPNWAHLLPPGQGFSDGGEFRNQKGIGDAIGEVTLEDGTKMEGGRILMQGAWNSWLHDPLADSYQEGKHATTRPDVHFYKNRSSGLCDKMTALTDFLGRHNLRTLLFTGINTDQCVMGTLQDAYLQGFDTIMLKDGCATDSPAYAQSSCEFNCLKSWGFLSTCQQLAEAVSGTVQEGSST